MTSPSVMVTDHSPLGFFVTVIRRSGNISTSLTPLPVCLLTDGDRLSRRKPRSRRVVVTGRLGVQRHDYECGERKCYQNVFWLAGARGECACERLIPQAAIGEDEVGRLRRRYL